MDNTTRSKRGAPRGNKNALKHGFYSHAYTEKERAAPNFGQGDLHGDIALFKVLLSRLAVTVNSTGAQPASFKENLSNLQIVSVVVARLNSLCYTNQKLYGCENDALIETCKMMKLTEAETRQEIANYEKRLSGGQPGNANALKHGYYASIFKPAEIRKLDKLKNGEVDEEIGLLRTLIKRTVASMPDYSEMSQLDLLKAFHIIAYADSCLEKLEITQKVAFHQNDPPYDPIQEALKGQEKDWELA